MCPQTKQPDVQTLDEDLEANVSETTRHPAPRQEQPGRPDGPSSDEEFEDTVSQTTQHPPPHLPGEEQDEPEEGRELDQQHHQHLMVEEAVEEVYYSSE